MNAWYEIWNDVINNEKWNNEMKKMKDNENE